MKLKTKKMATALALSTALFATSPMMAQSNQILLKSSDGSANLTGELVEFVDGFYTIDTDIGRFRVSAARMSCEGASCPQITASEADVTFIGSDTVGIGLMPLMLTGYANSLGADVELRTGSNTGQIIAEVIGDEGFGDKIGEYMVDSRSSSEGFKALAEKTAEVGMSSRRIKRKEAKSLRNAGAGNMVSADNEHIVAVDSLIVIVHPSNPIQTVTMAQLASIYSGQITNWKQLGGEDLPIRAVTRGAKSGTRAHFENAIFAGAGTAIDSIEIAPGNNEMAATVNSDEGAIGFVGYAFQRGAKGLNLTNQCGITVSPSTFSAKTEEYPMNRRLYLYTRGDNMPEAANDFLSYAKSAEADGLIAKAGFIDLGIERLSQNFTGDRMQRIIENTTDSFELGLMRELLVEMLQWDRLSTTLRFKSGSSKLDQKAEADVSRLINYLETLPLGTEVAVVGFTDSDGAFEANRELSIGRSAQASQAIQERGGERLKNIAFKSKGFGELSPSACNTTGDGKAINRRVEVWVRTPA